MIGPGDGRTDLPPADPLAWINAEAEARRAAGLARRLDPLGPTTPGHVAGPDGRPLVHFASNDYLGLAADPRVVEAGREAARDYGWGSGASPLVSGWRGPHRDLADALAAFEGTEAATLFPSGFAANLGTIAALVGPGDAVYSDRLNHASIFDGIRLSGARARIYPHNDAGRLGEILRRDRGRFRRSLIATDGVFSMDGDLAPLAGLAELADRFGAILLVDEAHGTGVFGDGGRGAAEALGVADRVDVTVGTLSKALGSVGGFAAGSRRLIDHLINHSRSLIYSTALPMAAAAAALRALEIVRAEPERRATLRRLSDQARDGLAALGWPRDPGWGPIVPVILGDPGRAVAASAACRERGLLVPAIRPPTVPRGTSRLRASLTAAHRDEEVAALLGVLAKFAGDPP
ncbi:8-amino-7-oxononanoate synthase [Tundrisphaera sp. TA3]|uniref:8-amino-7-oxononanoate synthase n=1 Tax=Tundrisphaera sp. TA3 TaxID=3435775 RepID=UPI003EB9C497